MRESVSWTWKYDSKPCLTALLESSSTACLCSYRKPIVSTWLKRDNAHARHVVESCPPEKRTSALSLKESSRSSTAIDLNRNLYTRLNSPSSHAREPRSIEAKSALLCPISRG